ncbi:MAG: argininosuccinate lyase [Planctomycetota bacterium]|nr:argininosuccinate lyase [Planctomycetota bacterium]
MAGAAPSEQSPSRSGVFSKPADPLTLAFSQSIAFDKALYRHDIAGSLAHAQMLHKVGLLKKSEEEAIRKGLKAILAEIEAGRFDFREEFEDIHMNVEKALEARIGPAAGKLHTARSRNDQVALDERLWLRDEIDRCRAMLTAVQEALLRRAEEYAADVMPGYTHLQRAQPVTCGHYLLAFVEMLERDKDRLAETRRRANVLPLGACALAGTSLPIDREYVAELLGFDGVTRNSMDTTGDRDHLVDFAYAMALSMVHLSRLAEDFILYASAEFGWLRIDDAWCTGSSIMPQKRNPDLLELIRGKTGRAVGTLNHLLVMLKGLPMTYNRDCQEDKELLFDTTKQYQSCLEVLSKLLDNLSFDRQKMAAACEGGYMDATALAEFLVQRGIPFRQAHHAAGQLVRVAAEKGKRLSELSIGELKQIHALLNEEARSVLGAKGVVAAYASAGSPNPKMVRREIQAWKKRLAQATRKAK